MGKRYTVQEPQFRFKASGKAWPHWSTIRQAAASADAEAGPIRDAEKPLPPGSLVREHGERSTPAEPEW
jgi:hypothetical protein